jgi:transketolase
MAENNRSVAELEEIGRRTRSRIIRMLAAANSDELRGGHAGGSLSCVELMVALYFSRMKRGDRFLLSKGHAAPCLYSVLAEKGLISEEDLKTLRRPGGLGGHPNVSTNGVEFPSGSLAQLLSVGIGMAIAERSSDVFVLIGDGEMQEGQIWEAVMCAAHHRLGNIFAIIDRNRIQETGWVKDVMDVEPLADKFRSFNWDVRVADGHDFGGILAALNAPGTGKPVAIIADTVKGKGFGMMENSIGWHGIHDRKELAGLA